MPVRELSVAVAVVAASAVPAEGAAAAVAAAVVVVAAGIVEVAVGLHRKDVAVVDTAFQEGPGVDVRAVPCRTPLAAAASACQSKEGANMVLATVRVSMEQQKILTAARPGT